MARGSRPTTKPATWFAGMRNSGIVFGWPGSAGQAENEVLRCQFLRCDVGIQTVNWNSMDIWVWYCRFEDCQHHPSPSCTNTVDVPLGSRPSACRLQQSKHSPRDHQRRPWSGRRGAGGEMMDARPSAPAQNGFLQLQIKGAATMRQASAFFWITWLWVVWPVVAADNPLVVELWPGKVPDETGNIGDGKGRDVAGSRPQAGRGYRVDQDGDQRNQTDDHDLSTGEGQRHRNGGADLSRGAATGTYTGNWRARRLPPG